MEGPETIIDPLEAAWQALQPCWEEAGRHERFVALAVSLDRLTDAARLYRTVKDEPGREAQASAALEKILQQAFARLSAGAHEPPKVRGLWLVPLVALTMLVVFTAVLALAFDKPQLRSPVVFLLEVVIVFAVPWRKLARKR